MSQVIKVTTTPEVSPEEKKKKQNTRIFTTGAICYILIPLIFSILVTTGVSITITTILSPYWSNLGGSELIEQEITTLNSLSITSANTIFEILQKISDSRSQILLYYWKNIKLKQIDQSLSDRIKIIKNNHCYNLYDLQQQTLTTEDINNYDGVTQESQTSFGWGIVIDNILTPNQVLDSQQQNYFEEYISTLPMLQIIISSDSLFQVYAFFHSINNVFVTYPLQINFKIQSPLNQMQSNFMISQKLYYDEMIDFYTNLIQSCVILQNGNKLFTGIFCMGIEIKGLRNTIQIISDSSTLDFQFFSIFPFIDMNVMATNSKAPGVETMNKNNISVFLYPKLIDILFQSNNQSQQANDFRRVYGPIFYGDQNIYYLLYNGKYYNNQNQQIQADSLEIFQEEYGVEDGVNYLKQNSILIQLNVNDFKNSFVEVAKEIQKNVFSLIIYITLPIALVICLIASCIAYSLIKAIVIPLADLQKKLEMIKEDTMSIEIYSNFKASSLELNQLYETLHRLVTVLNFANDKYFEDDDAMLLIKFAQGLKLFKDMHSLRGMGLNLNNIANIHKRQGRYLEAVRCYNDALYLCEQELFSISETQNINELYPFIKKSDNTSYSHQMRLSIKQQMPILEQVKQNNPEQTLINHRDRETAKSKLEDIYANRSFSLANAIMQRIKQISQREMIEKINSNNKYQDDRSFREVIDHLHATLYFDERQRKNQYRQITGRVLLSKAHLKVGEVEQALKEITKAEECLSNYENQYEELAAQNWRNVHPGILRQSMLFQEGILCQSAGKIRRAASIFTECLETSKYFDPEIREQCLECLHDIFAKQNILRKAPNIAKLLSHCKRKKNKDIIFAIDFSQSMENEKLECVVNKLTSVFDSYIQSEDRVGLVRFNQTYEVVFDLTLKKENTKFLRKSIKKQKKIAPRGQSGLLQAILFSLTLFEKTADLGHSKWVIVLTDGEDNLSNISKKKMEALISRYSDISLIVIGVALNPDCSEELNDLCRRTKEGFFINSIESEDVDIAFQSLANVLSEGRNLDYEVEQLK